MIGNYVRERRLQQSALVLHVENRSSGHVFRNFHCFFRSCRLCYPKYIKREIITGVCLVNDCSHLKLNEAYLETTFKSSTKGVQA